VKKVGKIIQIGQKEWQIMYCRVSLCSQNSQS